VTEAKNWSSILDSDLERSRDYSYGNRGLQKQIISTEPFTVWQRGGITERGKGSMEGWA
jgi:hypothetical protein